MSSKVLLLAEFGGVSINPYNQLSCLQQSHCIERDNDRLLFMLSVFAIRSFRANQHKMPGKAFQCWFWWKRSKAKHMEQPEPCGSNEYVEGDIFRDGGLFVSSASFYHSLCIVQALFWFLGAVSVGLKGVELLHKQLNWYCIMHMLHIHGNTFCCYKSLLVNRMRYLSAKEKVSPWPLSVET